VAATEPKRAALRVADALQDAATAAGPQKALRADPRTFTSALEGIWRAAGMEPVRVSASWVSFFPEYLDACEISPGTRVIYTNFLTSFTKFLGPEKAGGLMQSVTHGECQGFYDSLVAKGLSLKTARGYLKSVRACFDRAQKLGVVPLNPASLVRTPLGGREGKRDALSLPEIARVLAVLADPPPEVGTGRGFLRGDLPGQWRTAVLLGLWCGMRLGDATVRRWGDFSPTLEQVTFLPQKKSRRGVSVTLPVVGVLREHLLSLERGGDDDLVTPGLAYAEPGSNRGKNSVRFAKILDLAGVGADAVEAVNGGRARSDGGAGKPKRRKSFHSLRHTVLTELARAGVDKQLRQLMADHDDPAVNDRYTHAQVERLATALASAFPA
jgi:integrase